MLPLAGQAKHPFEIHGATAITILDIYLFFHHNGVTLLCVKLWDGPRVSLSLFLLL